MHLRSMLTVFATTLAALALLACSTTPDGEPADDEEVVETPADTDVPAGDADADPIPRTVLFDDAAYSRVRISPDGDQIAYLAPRDGVRNLWVGPADDPDRAQPVTDEDDRGIRSYFWTYTGDHLVYARDDDGDENWTLYGVDLDSGDEQRLTPESDVQARVLQVSPDRPQEVLVELNDRDPRFHDVHRVDVTTGDSELVVENPGFAGFYADSDFEIRLAVRETDDGGEQWLVPDDEPDQPDDDEARDGDQQPTADATDPDEVPDGWKLYDEIGLEDSMTTNFQGLDRSGQTAWAVDSRDRTTGALVEFDFEENDREVVHADDRADVVDIMRSPDDWSIQAAAVEYERTEWTVLDDEIAGDLDYLEDLEEGELQVLSRSLDDDRWIVHYGLDDEPGRYYRYDRDVGDAEFLFVDRPDLQDYQLNEMTPVTIETRDGLEMVSYLTVPHFAATDEAGMPEEAIPMVLNVHGGPWARDSWGYDPVHQWLADRGYVVLSVNFRGSTGFGKDFLNAGNREWGGKMHDDLIDAVDWAVDAGIAGEDDVAIMGGSYGGYATLAGLTFTPETFACGVNIVGVSNLITLLEALPPYWEPIRTMFEARVGDPETEEGRQFLRERSPLFHVDNIQRPLLIGHGAHDPRVKREESDQIVEAMVERDIPVTYAMYPDEGHGFARPENRISFFAVAEAFLSECIDGRFEPVDGDFDGASLQILEGAGHIPGLPEALEDHGDQPDADSDR